MKHIQYILLIATVTTALCACENRELYRGGKGSGKGIGVSFVNTDGSPMRTADQMRVNIFSLTGGVANYGVDDFPAATGGELYLPFGSSHLAMCYSYNSGTGIYYRNESDLEKAEAYCALMNRSTYTRSYPGEVTRAAAEVTTLMYQGAERFDVAADFRTQTMTFCPHNILQAFHITIENVIGVENIAEVRGAITGISTSFLLYKGEPSSQTATLFFPASMDKATGEIYCDFGCFGKVEGNENFLTLEVLSKDGELLTFRWNVSSRIPASRSGAVTFAIKGAPDINGDPSDQPVVVPGNGGGGADKGGSGFGVGVSEWKEEEIILE